MIFSGNSRCISDCFSSSRLKMISFFSLYRLSTVLVNLRPNDPVPPVTMTTLLFRSIIVSISDCAQGDVPEPRQRHLKLGAERPWNGRCPHLFDDVGVRRGPDPQRTRRGRQHDAAGGAVVGGRQAAGGVAEDE